ncbi:hypothetical protein B0E46_17105, partial [Rhodanobacter sp. B04]
MFARHDLQAWQAANKLSSELYGNGDTVDAGLCRQRDQALQQSLRDDPVSLVLWDVAYRCAAAVGDDALAGQRGQAMAALLKQSLDARPLGEENTPIRISTSSDAFTLIRHSGQQLLYAYYDVFSNAPPMTLHVALWDAGAQRERWLSFDVTDSVAQLSGDPKLRYPIARQSLGLQWLKLVAAKEPQSYSASALRTYQLHLKPVDATVINGYQDESRRGNYLGAYALGYLCLAGSDHGCGSQAVDALLPWAEHHSAQSMLFLARAYATGNGVKADRDAAMKLLLAADARLGDGRGLRWYAQSLVSDKRASSIDAEVWQRLQKRAAGDDVPALLLLIAHQWHEHTGSLDSGQRAALERAAAAGYREAQYFYSLVLRQQGHVAAAQSWLHKAADAGLAVAQADLADAYRFGRGEPLDMVQALGLYGRAATQGNAAAMKYLGYWHQFVDTAPDHLVVAERWLQSAILVQDRQAPLNLAYLYIIGGQGLDSTPAQGLQYLRALAAAPDGAEARRRLAGLLADGDHVPKDFVEARSLLTGDAKNGDVASQSRLGLLLTNTGNPQRDPAEGLRWLRQAAASHDAEAMAALGKVYVDGAGGHKDLPGALALWREAAAKGNFAAINDLAWWSCTSRDPVLHNPALGMSYARSMELRADLDPAGRDTVAACYAAQGQFDRALAIEQRALTDMIRIESEQSPNLQRLRDHLALYRLRQTSAAPKSAWPPPPPPPPPP